MGESGREEERMSVPPTLAVVEAALDSAGSGVSVSLAEAGTQ